MLLALATALWGVGAGVLAPGWAICRSLGLARSGGAAAELALAFAAGRLAIAAATAAAIALGAPSALVAWPALGCAAAALVVLREKRGPFTPRLREWGRASLPFVAGLAAAALLVHAVAGRNGVENAAGRLLFFGRDATNDSLMYLAQSRMLLEIGFPIANPFFAGVVSSNSYVPFLVRAGLHAAAGVSWLDATFRVMPLLDVCSLAVTSGALVAALGGSRLAVGLGAVLGVLGSEASFVLPALAKLGGGEDLRLASWGFGGPALLPFNSIAPAVQTAMAALVLLAIPAPRPRAAAIAVGVLFAALFELKLFLWMTSIVALAAVAAVGAPRALRSGLRLAAATAVLLSLPSLVDKALYTAQMRAQGIFDTGIRLCPGCFPRYLADGALSREAAPWSLFSELQPGDLLDAETLARTLLACAVFALVLLGARWIAVPTLVRIARRGASDPSDAGAAAAARITLVGAGIGLGLSMLLAWRPHYLNVGQFAWSATFLLWPFTALAIGRWWPQHRAASVLALAASLLSTSGVVFARGYGAPPWLAVEPGERALVEELGSLSRPGEIVIEPSFGLRPEVPSIVPWLAGRPVVFTDRSIATQIKDAPRLERLAQLEAVFKGQDSEAAAAALRASGASWVYAPAPVSLRFATQGLLVPAAESRAGRIYRVVAGGSSERPGAQRAEPGP